jgi:hypothetical protein
MAETIVMKISFSFIASDAVIVIQSRLPQVASPAQLSRNFFVLHATDGK